MCHQCNDLTSDLKTVYASSELYEASDGHELQKDNDTVFVLPNGHFLVNTNGCHLTVDGSCGFSPPIIAEESLEKLTMTSFSTGDPKKTNSMQDIDTLIWSMSIIHPDMESMTNSSKPYYDYDWPGMTIRAAECAIYYCVKTIDSKVEGNIIHENITKATDTVRGPDS